MSLLFLQRLAPVQIFGIRRGLDLEHVVEAHYILVRLQFLKFRQRWELVLLNPSFYPLKLLLLVLGGLVDTCDD